MVRAIIRIDGCFDPISDYYDVSMFIGVSESLCESHLRVVDVEFRVRCVSCDVGNIIN